MSTIEVESVPEAPQALEEPTSEYRPFKVFINQVDAFNSRYIAQYCTDQIYGASRIPQGGGEEAAAEEPAIPPTMPPLSTDKYEFVGTLSRPYRSKSEDILYTVSESDAELYREEVMKCGFVVFDITRDSTQIERALFTLKMIEDELDKIRFIGEKTFDNFSETKNFILISTLMTWGKTKPLDPSDPDLPFSEVDYRKRRPHPNYKEHYNCEKEVIKIGQKFQDKLKTYVVCSGFTYGMEEEDLQYFFKMAWHNEVIPIFDSGTNRIPFIHVKDLARALHGLMENTPQKPQYILAVEQTPCKLKQFMKSLSKSLSDGKTINVVAEEAFLLRDMTQSIFEKFTVNVTMEPVFIVENLQIQWQNEMNIAENMNEVVREFKATRRLMPVKIVLHGPPGSGKTILAKKLCDHYKCHYVSVETMLQECLKEWREILQQPPKPKVEEEYLGEEALDEEMDEEEDREQVAEYVREVETLLENGLEKMPDDYVIGHLRKFLEKNICQNRGYVLDNYPYITVQAKELFGQASEVGGEEEEALPGEPSKILPDVVISIQACDEYVSKRIMQLPEEEIKDTPYEEESMRIRLEEFRRVNDEDNTVLNYFDELEVDILLLDVMDDENLDKAFNTVTEKFGPPLGFGLTFEEEEELYRLEQEEQRLALEKELLEKQLFEERAIKEKNDKMEGWAEMMEKLQWEEEKVLIAQTEPLRHYLMKFVFPTLTKGMIELAKVKPDDPVDFLAEFLFKENPEGRMFDPAYTEECAELYDDFRKDIEKILDSEAFNE